MNDVYNQLDSIFGNVLDDVKSMSGSAVIQDVTAQQSVYGSYSNVSVMIDFWRGARNLALITISFTVRSGAFRTHGSFLRQCGEFRAHG
jgi:hypothetical protein